MGIRHKVAGQLQEVPLQWRTEGTFQGMESYAGPAVCLHRIKVFPAMNAADGKLFAEMTKEWDCASFDHWHQGFTPKEHQEMIQEATLLKIQQE